MTERCGIPWGDEGDSPRCQLEAGHAEHCSYPSERTYTAAELAQAETRGVQRGLEMAAQVCDEHAEELIANIGKEIPFPYTKDNYSYEQRDEKCKSQAYTNRISAQRIRALQPVPQAPQAEREMQAWRVAIAFNMIGAANTVTILSLNEMEAIVIRSLNGEFDKDKQP